MTRRPRARAYRVGALLVFSWCRPAAAYRPFDGTDADVVEKGQLELEVGPAGYRQEGPARLIVVPALVANYGFARGFEAVLEGRQAFQLSGARHSSQIQDAALSLKSLLREGTLQGGRGVSIAVETSVLLPGFETGFGAHVASIFSMRWPALTLDLNLGNDLWFSAQYRASAGLILEGPDRWRLRPVAELRVERNFGHGGFVDGFAEGVLLGGIARCSDALAFDVAGRLGHTVDGRLEEARAGFTWAFEAW